MVLKQCDAAGRKGICGLAASLRLEEKNHLPSMPQPVEVSIRQRSFVTES